MTGAAASPNSAHLPDGVVEREGHRYMVDSAGRLVPIEVVKPAHLLKDQLVRKLVARAEEVSKILAQFRQDTLDEVEALRDLLDEAYEVKIGGPGGNIQIQSYDGTLKVEVQIAQRVSYGPEIQAAKALVDECMYDWTKELVQPEVRAIIADAFVTDKQGSYSRTSLLRLRRFEFKDPRWVRAMQAISDAEMPDGTKTYARYHKRRSPKDKFRQISLDAATA